MAEIVFVRHGETTGNSAIRLYGATDLPLSDEGRDQVRHAAALLSDDSFDRVITSPLSRAIESAQIVLGDRPHTPEIIEAFREMNFGAWEGWTFAEASERDPENYALWEGGALDFSFPGGGDSRGGFKDRIQTAGYTIFEPPHQKVLAVLHKGVIKSLIGGLLRISYAEHVKLDCDLGSIHRLVHDGAKWNLTVSNLR